MKLSAAVWKALVLGVLVGLVGAVSPACGPPKKPVTCNAANCPGCCDGNQMCFTGLSEASCGTMGATCMACGSGQTCLAVTTGDAGAQGGRCLTAGTGGGSSGGGGTAGGATAGGAAAGGNAAGGTGGGSANCNAQNCPNGCCTSTGACQNPPTTARCGMGGATCAGCMPGKTCVNGACTTCAGCVDLQSGRCETGMTDSACGKNGEFCANCTVNSATCTNQACVGNMGGCNPSNCGGCCDGQNCVQPSAQSGMQCGQGQAGSLCVSCNGGTCDTSDAGLCMGGAGGGAGGGTGGGLPGLDGGFGGTCDGVTSLCGSTECCLAALGVCVPVGQGLPPIAVACGINGGVCRNCVFQMCDTATGMCQ